jgi:hypothetical protein
MDGFATGLPFEAQTEPRGCGAASLAMIYRALGTPVPQSEIWPHIARRNARGSVASTTCLIARDAISRGFTAIAVQARDRLATLRACEAAGIYAILATRSARNATDGHYTVLTGIDSTNVRLHDPADGPERVLPHAVLLSLWDKPADAVEVTGGMLIAIGMPQDTAAECKSCHARIPDHVDCPRCHHQVLLRPLAPIGCLAASCSARLWQRICCPSCDLLWDASGGATDAPGPGAEPEIDTAKMFAALDAFAAATLAIPGAAAHADVKSLLGELGGMRDKIAGALANDAAARIRLQKQREAAAAAIAAQAASLRARRPPPPPAPTTLTLDPAVLGASLMERLAK